MESQKGTFQLNPSVKRLQVSRFVSNEPKEIIICKVFPRTIILFWIFGCTTILCTKDHLRNNYNSPNTWHIDGHVNKTTSIQTAYINILTLARYSRAYCSDSRVKNMLDVQLNKLSSPS